MPRESADRLKLWKRDQGNHPGEPQAYKSSPSSFISSATTDESHASDANESSYIATLNSAGETCASGAAESLRHHLNAKDPSTESRDPEDSENSSSIGATAILNGLPPRGSQNQEADSSSIRSDRSVRTVITYRPSSSSAKGHGEDGDGGHIISQPQFSAPSVVGTSCGYADESPNLPVSIFAPRSSASVGEAIYDFERSDEQYNRLKEDLKKKLAMQSLPPDWWKSDETFQLSRGVPPPARPPKDCERYAGEGYITFYRLNTVPRPLEIWSAMIYLNPKHFHCRTQIELAARYGIPKECCLSFGYYAGATTRELLDDLERKWQTSWNDWELDPATRKSLWSAFLLHWQNLEQALPMEESE